MIETEFYYLDEAAKKLGYAMPENQPEWKNPVIRIGAEGCLPIYILTHGLFVWEQFRWVVTKTNTGGEMEAEIKEDFEPFLEKPKRLKLALWCLEQYAAGREDFVAYSDEGRPYNSEDFEKSELIIRCSQGHNVVTIFEPVNNARLKDSVLIVLAEDLRRFQESISLPELITQEVQEPCTKEEAILLTAKRIEHYPRLPRNGLNRLESECLKDYPRLFQTGASVQTVYRRMRELGFFEANINMRRNKNQKSK